MKVYRVSCSSGHVFSGQETQQKRKLLGETRALVLCNCNVLLNSDENGNEFLTSRTGISAERCLRVSDGSFTGTGLESMQKQKHYRVTDRFSLSVLVIIDFRTGHERLILIDNKHIQYSNTFCAVLEVFEFQTCVEEEQ